MGAVIISELVFQQHRKREEWFPFSEREIEDRTGITRHQQETILSELKDHHLIRTKRSGMPARRFFSLNYSKILSISPESLSPELRGHVTRITGTNKELSIKDLKVFNYSEDENSSSGILHSKEDELIEHWNKMPNVQKHAIGKTKTYHQLIKSIKCLKKGKFFKLYNVSNKKLDVSIKHKKFSDEEIKTTFEKLAKLFIEGYWPKDKSRLPRNLNSLIYNPMSGYSMFMQCFESEPKRMAEAIKCRFPLMLEKYNKFIESLYTKLPDSEIKLMTHRVNSIGVYRMKIHEKFGEKLKATGFSSVIGGAERDSVVFADTHITFMKKDTKPDSVMGGLIVGSYKWKDFIKWIYTFHGYDITGEEKK